MASFRNPGRVAGITALELLLVLAIATLLAGVGIPGLQEFTLRKRMDAGVTRLHTDLNFARRQAIVRTLQVVACPGNEQAGCLDIAQWEDGWLVYADHNGDRLRQSSEPILRTGNALELLSVRSAETRRSIRFSPAGAAPASNASIVFCDRRGLDGGRKLVISNTGRMRRAELDAADAPRCVQ